MYREYLILALGLVRLGEDINQDFSLRFLGLFGVFWGKVWALGPKVWEPMVRVQEP